MAARIAEKSTHAVSTSCNDDFQLHPHHLHTATTQLLLNNIHVYNRYKNGALNEVYSPLSSVFNVLTVLLAMKEGKTSYIENL